MSDLIERLDQGLDERAAKCTDQRDGFYMRAAAARIRELEAELTTCKEINDRLQARVHELRAIEEATIERCAQELERFKDVTGWHHLAMAIRALAKPEADILYRFGVKTEAEAIRNIGGEGAIKTDEG